MKRMLAGVLALAATTTLGTCTLIPAAYAATTRADEVNLLPSPDTFALQPVISGLPRVTLPLDHVVRAGDTLSDLAVKYCKGHDKDWTGFYEDNRKVIGGNPNLIVPGQKLSLKRCTDPPQLLRLGSTWRAHRVPVRHPARHRARNGKIWGVTYGYPYKCGDGDGDGYDKPCTRLHPTTPGHRAHRSVRRVYHAAPASRSYAGHYSYAGLEALWISAGGPAWAASAAAAVAECESGGNPSAHNPSGATSLWQILGQVVPGNLYNPYVNAENAVAKFKASGNTWSQWVCKP